jgi:hypothetical protein
VNGLGPVADVADVELAGVMQEETLARLVGRPDETTSSGALAQTGVNFSRGTFGAAPYTALGLGAELSEASSTGWARASPGAADPGGSVSGDRGPPIRRADSGSAAGRHELSASPGALNSSNPSAGFG